MLTRRRVFSLPAGGRARPLLFREARRSAEETAPPLDTLLPFTRGGVARAGREVFAHWHIFPISLDNRPAKNDCYATEFLSPKSTSGKNSDYGSLFRERPLPRPSINSPAWAVGDMERDIRWAHEIGIDAFLYNVISIDPACHYWQLLLYMLEAATRVGSAFRVVPNLDATLLANQPVAKISEAIKSVSGHPMLLRRGDGQLVLGAFAAEAWPAEKWIELFDDLAKADIKIEFIPTFLNVRSATPGHWKIADAVSEWSGNYVDGVANHQGSRAIVKDSGKPWSSPVWTHDFRPKDSVYGEAGDSRPLRD